MKTWIKFHELNMRDGRKTKVWAVLTIDGLTVLGHVQWFAPWRKYAYFPKKDTIYEQDCMRVLSQFIEAETSNHKLKAKGEA
jgi:hypothetical protein